MKTGVTPPNGRRNRMPQELTPEIVRAAIAGFQQERLQIDAQIAELRAMLFSGNTATNSPGSTAPKRRRFSAESRRRMALAQRARWARIRGESEPSAPAPAESAQAEAQVVGGGPEGYSERHSEERWAQKRAEAARAQILLLERPHKVRRRVQRHRAAKRTAPAMAAKRKS